MNNTQLSEEQINFQILNFLNSSYQGKFAAINILSQLEHPSFSKEDLIETKKILKKIHTWTKDFKAGNYIISDQKKSEKAKSEKELIGLLKADREELNNLADSVERIRKIEQLGSALEDTTLLAAAFGRYAYSQDNFLRMIVDYQKNLDEKNYVLFQYERQLEQAQEETKLANKFLTTLKEPKELEQGFYEHLRFFSRLTPGAFRSRAHDINQLLCAGKTDLSYKMAGLVEEEISSWEEMGLTPIEAGYWKAYSFEAHEAMKWIKLSIIDPGTASAWNTAGFSPQVSDEWLEFMFSPLLAIQWYNADFTAEQAAILVGNGFYNPAELPNRKEVDRLLEQGFPKDEEEQVEDK